MRRKHESVRAYLLGAIGRELRPGSRLPSEREIAERLGVSRPTVRRALEQLASEGRVRRVHGSGTFVAEPPTGDRRAVARARLLRARETVAGARQSWRLGVSPGEPLWRVERLLLAGGGPVAIETRFIVKAVAPGLLDHPLDASLHELLAERYGIVVVRSRNSVTATLLEPPTADVLGVPALSPGLAVERVSIDERGRRVELVDSLRPGDRCALEWESWEA